jgi:hypothetical protein
MQPLARQKQWQIITDFTTLCLHNPIVEHIKGYKKNKQENLTCPALVEFLGFLKLQSVGISGSTLKT